MTPEIYLVKVDSPIDESDFQYLLEFVQPEKKERILKQKIKQNADNMLIGEILAKVVIKKIFDVAIADQEFVYTEHGKPCFCGCSNINFNISHSGEFVVCAINERPIGIDIQQNVEYDSNIAELICSKQEFIKIENSINRADEFTKLWTQKEAILKMYGIGMSEINIKECLINMDVRSHKFMNYWISYVSI